MAPFLVYAALALGAYLMGSIPAAVWLSRRFYGMDIRTVGSGNAGSTNMYRTFGFKAGFITQIFDVIKGVVAVLLPVWFAPPAANDVEQVLAQVLCGVAAVAGHTFPVFAGFRGGKGVNTILGMMLALHPLGSLIGVVIFALVLSAGRMVSLASMCAVASFPLYIILVEMNWRLSRHSEDASLIFLALGVALAGYVVYSHRTNIARIREGTERKVNLWKAKRT